MQETLKPAVNPSVLKIIDQISDAVFLFDDCGNLFYSNQACISLFGFHSESELKKNIVNGNFELKNNADILPFPPEENTEAYRNPLYVSVKPDGKKCKVTCTIDHIETDDHSLCILMMMKESNFLPHQNKKAEMPSSLSFEHLQPKKKDIYQNIPVGLCLIDLDMRFIHVNKWLADINGVPVEDHIGKTIKEIIPSLFDQACLIIKQILDTQKPMMGVEFSGYPKDQPEFIRTWKEDWLPVMSNSGKIIGFSVVIEEITDRKMAEKALEKSLRRFELLADISNQLLQSTSPQKLIESLCLNVMHHLDCQVFFNYLVEKKERLHLNAFSGIPGDKAKEIEFLHFGEAICGCVAFNGKQIVAGQIQTSDDQRTTLVKSLGIRAYACHPLLSENGEVIGTLSFGTKNRDQFNRDDLSLMKAVTDQVAIAMDRIHKEHELEIMAARDEAILNSLTEGLVIIGPDGIFQHMNPAALRMHGFDSPEEMWTGFERYVEIFELLDDKGAVIPLKEWPVSKISRDEAVLNYVVKLHRRDKNTEKIISYNGVRVNDSSGKYINMVFSMHDITEIYLRTLEAEEGKRTLEAIMENVPEGITIADTGGNMKMMSRYGMNLLGCNRFDMTVSEFFKEWEVYFPGEKKRIPEEEIPLLRAVRGEITKDFQLNQTGSSGEEIPLLCNAGPIKNKEGVITGGIVTWRDMTERKNLIRELEAERELLQTIIDKVPVMFAIWEPRLDVLKINKAIERHTGWTDEDNERYGIMNLTYPDPEYRSVVTDFMSTLSPHFKDIKMVTKNGKTIETTWANIEISDGRRVGIGIDISERKAFEQQLSDLSHRLKTVLENIYDGVIVYAPDGKLLSMNRAALGITGRLSDDPFYPYVQFYELYDENNQFVPVDNWPVNRCLKGEYFNMEVFRCVNAENKKELFLEYSGIPVYEEGKLILAIITVHNITERKLAQMEMSKTLLDLNTKNARLLKMNQLHENLLYIISHDLRGPLANMHTIIDVINLIPGMDEKMKMIASLKEMVKKQDNIISGLSDIIEVQSPEKVRSKQVLLKTVVDDIIQENEIVLKAVKGTVHYDFSAVQELNYNKTFMVSILKNLITNAIKYRDEKRFIHIEVKSSKTDGYVLITVKDNGTGIDMTKNGKNIFQPFKRFTKEGEGKGIGLYITRNLIEKNGGYIKVDSTPNEGTCFYCYFREYLVSER